MTFNDLFKVTIIQRQITWKWYSIRLYLQWPTNRKSYMIYWTAPCSMTLNDTYPCFKVTPFFGAEYLRNTTYIHSFNGRDLHTPYSAVSFRMTLSDLEWLNKIFNDTKRGAVSLRQLIFLYRWQCASIFIHFYTARSKTYTGQGGVLRSIKVIHGPSKSLKLTPIESRYVISY